MSDRAHRNPVAEPRPDPRDGFCLGGVPVRLEVASATLAGRIEPWLAEAFLLEAREQEDPRSETPPLHLRARAGSAPEPVPAAASRQSAATGDRVRRLGERVFLTFPEAHGHLDLAAGRAELWLADAWWTLPRKQQQDPWLLSLVWLLRERGRYAFHASAVVRDGRGLLIAGNSGSGKSSTALALIDQGWDWLADDVVVLDPGSPPRLRGLAQGFALSPALAHRLPGLTGEAGPDKILADLTRLYPGRRAASCLPAALLFPRVTGEEVSRLEPLAPTEALLALLPASAGLLVGGASGPPHLDALRRLATTLPAFRLEAGRDVFGRGAVLESLLRSRGLDWPGARPRA